jgi:cytoskeleton protein RodZ
MNDSVIDAKLNTVSTKLGPQLKVAREAFGWSVEHAAEQLKWAPRQLSALEADDYQILRDIATVRGFVRAYAKLLKLDPAPLIATLEKQNVLTNDVFPVRRELATPFAKVRLPSMHKRGLSANTWGLIAAIILVIGVVVAGQMGYLKPLPPDLLKQPPTLASAPAPTATPAPASPSSSSAITTSIPASIPAPTPVSIPASSPTIVSSQVPRPTENAALAAKPPSPAPAPVSAENVLVLKVLKDSWVQVKTVSGNVMLSRLLKAGETETVPMSNPVQVVIGNAAGIEATLRGTPLTLKSGAGNIARLTLQ